MKHKDLIASIYLKHGQAVAGPDLDEAIEDIDERIRQYNDNGIDRLLIFDLSDSDLEHERHLGMIKEWNRSIQLPVCAGGRVNRLEDIKKLLYAGCKQVMLNGSRSDVAALAKEGCQRFGAEKLALSLNNVDILFKHKDAMEESVSEMIIINEKIVDSVSNITDIPSIVMQEQYDLNCWTKLLQREHVRGIFGDCLNHIDTDVMKLKADLSQQGIDTRQFESALDFDTFKLNSDGMIPVIVQDYQTQEVLMLAYMNREAFDHTIASGNMTYYSRSRKQLWVKGETSGHYQYVKSLTLDCDNDTILAKVSQVGNACHTGAPSCFFQELVKKDYVVKNPLKVLETVYDVIADRKEHPKEGSYTNYLFEKGIDKILKKVGEEATEIVIAAKNPDAEEIKYEISDFLYHVMVLMVEKGVTWEDISQELAQR
ncbi:MAG: bifunctional phosphoribosyl-AMP cyclohydrolase/phosphoribosyl-ATP diphosphatase HisIE [Lachnospiraceae bacterium]|nr:bifunctional phosphoribosyl-AMP cyclohydrolase/phosphoribosyl-ATP diphosphatase HisIE [Lachnospiraceae bacterium]